jgi:K+-sensing histidine kinase KdpD
VIEIERSSDEVTIKVLDEGIGISSDTDRIFEPFYRSESAVIRAEGLGIGLTVCKRLVEAQNGRMWAQPRASGGSEFGFALPILPDYEE